MEMVSHFTEAVIEFVEALGLWGWIAVVIIACVAIDALVKLKRMRIKHIERMAKIQQGIDPGDETEAYKKDEL